MKKANTYYATKKILIDVEEPVREKEWPASLYHATDSSNLPSILEKGLLEGNDFAGIFFCLSPEDIAKFAVFRGFGDGTIIRVDTRFLQKDSLYWSTDHNERIIRAKALVYLGDIPPEALTVQQKGE